MFVSKPAHTAWKPIGYHEVPASTLVNAANLISRVSNSDIERCLAAHLRHYCGLNPLTPLAIEISKDDLIGHPEACVIARLSEELLVDEESGSRVAGYATLLYLNPPHDHVPVVVLPPAPRETTLSHEKIHLCQYLSGDRSLLTQEELTLTLQNDLVKCLDRVSRSVGKAKAADFILRVACHKLWIELEAHYYAGASRPAWDKLLHDAIASSNPINTLFGALTHLSVSKSILDFKLRKLQEFCVELMQVSWLMACRGISAEMPLYEELWLIERGMD
jgi:hypothetical protein